MFPKKVKQLTVSYAACSSGYLQVFPPADCRINSTPHCSLRPSCFIYLSDTAQGGEADRENLCTPVQLCGRAIWSRF